MEDAHTITGGVDRLKEIKEWFIVYEWWNPGPERRLLLEQIDGGHEMHTMDFANARCVLGAAKSVLIVGGSSKVDNPCEVPAVQSVYRKVDSSHTYGKEYRDS